VAGVASCPTGVLSTSWRLGWRAGVGAGACLRRGRTVHPPTQHCRATRHATGTLCQDVDTMTTPTPTQPDTAVKLFRGDSPPPTLTMLSKQPYVNTFTQRVNTFAQKPSTAWRKVPAADGRCQDRLSIPPRYFTHRALGQPVDMLWMLVDNVAVYPIRLQPNDLCWRPAHARVHRATLYPRRGVGRFRSSDWRPACSPIGGVPR